jgi:acetyltransferase-like isoleucine patch superfamily enzyme
MKKQLEKIIQKRNPNFSFDSQVGLGVLLGLSVNKLVCSIRSLKLLFRFRVPRYLILGRGVKFFNLPKIKLGRWVKLDDFVFLSALGKGEIRIGDNSGIGAFSRIVISSSFNNLGAHIHIGKNVGIGEFAYLGGAGGLEIGDDCIVGQYLSCHPENHNCDSDEVMIRHQGVSRKGIKIGKNCWIGSKVTVLDGVVVGDNCVIAAGAVLTKSFPDNAVIGGVPARIIKYRTSVFASNSYLSISS